MHLLVSGWTKGKEAFALSHDAEDCHFSFPAILGSAHHLVIGSQWLEDFVIVGLGLLPSCATLSFRVKVPELLEPSQPRIDLNFRAAVLQVFSY